MLSNVRAAVPLLDTEERPEGKARAEKAFVYKNPQNKVSSILNNSSGYVGIERSPEDDPKVGMNGRKTFAFWTLVVLLLILAAGNLLLTITILSVLHLGQGTESIELIPEASIIKFMGNTEFEHVYHKSGRLHGFRDVPVSIEGSNGGAVRFSLASRSLRSPPHQVLSVSQSGVAIDGVSSFTVSHPTSGKTVFSTTNPTYNIPTSSRNLNVKMMSTKRISARVDDDLLIRSDTSANFHGTEGTRMDGKEMVWSADQDIFLKSINGSIILSGKEGVFIDVKNIPLAKSHDDNGVPYNDAKGQFKVCVCMPQGKLFRLPIPSGQARVSCSHINLSSKYNPCI